MKKVVLILLAIAILALGGWYFFGRADNRPPVTNQSGDETAQEEALAGPSGPRLIIGAESAPITIVEYGDFQCPVCKRFFENAEPEIIANWIDTGRAKIEFRVETHIGLESGYAGEAAYCAAEQGKFRQLHDLLYRRQSGIDSGVFGYEQLKSYGEELDLSADFADCLDSHRYRDAVAASDAEADQRISGTPTFFIGEHKIAGAQPYAVFKAVLDSQ
jgi:protein-disulfide isomerase